MARSAWEDVVWLAYTRGVEGKRGGVRQLCGFGQMVVVLWVCVAAVPRLQMDTRMGEQLTLWREKTRKCLSEGEHHQAPGDRC